MRKLTLLVISILQELYQWSSVAGISRTVLGIRYSILHTLFYKTHRPVDTTNTPTATVTRPLFFEFQKDVDTYSIDRQFMIGSAIMISPVLTQGERKLGEGGRRDFPLFHRSYKCWCLFSKWKVVQLC